MITIAGMFGLIGVLGASIGMMVMRSSSSLISIERAAFRELVGLGMVLAGILMACISIGIYALAGALL